MTKCQNIVNKTCAWVQRQFICYAKTNFVGKNLKHNQLRKATSN